MSVASSSAPLDTFVPELNVFQNSEDRWKIRQEAWDQHFGKTYESFAKLLACKIASEASKTFSKAISDPYNKPITEELKIVHQQSLNFTCRSVAKHFIDNVQELEDYPPFSEWLHHFTVEEPVQSIGEEHFSSIRVISKDVLLDKEFFNTVIKVLGGCVRKEIKAIFNRLAQQSGNENFKFSVTWRNIESGKDGAISKTLSSIARASSEEDYSIRVRMWLADNGQAKETAELPVASLTKARVLKGRTKVIKPSLEQKVFVVIVAIAMIAILQFALPAPHLFLSGPVVY